MTDKSFISEASATGEEIHAIVSALEPVLLGVPRSSAIIACLSIAITSMNPDISAEQLQAGVKEVSQFICMFLEEVEPGLPREKMN